MRKLFEKLPTRNAFYPGAAERLDRFAGAHPESTRQFGEDSLGRLPWTFITDLDPMSEDEICYSTEAFTSVFVETSIGADSPAPSSSGRSNSPIGASGAPSAPRSSSTRIRCATRRPPPPSSGRWQSYVTAPSPSTSGPPSVTASW